MKKIIILSVLSLLILGGGISLANTLNQNTKDKINNSALANSANSSASSSERVGCFKFISNIKYKDGLQNNKINEVKELQESLYNKGYLKVNPTGFFGTLTFEAVKKYQKDNNIPQTGFVGNMTRGILRSHFCGDSIEGTNENVCCMIYPVVPDGEKYGNYELRNKSNCQAPCQKITDSSGNTIESCAVGASYKVVSIDLCKEKNPPEQKNCKVWFDGCNTCTRGENSSDFACTKMACPTQKQTPYCKEYFESEKEVKIPDNCKTWFDGCNTCGRSEEGKPTACTLMACLDNLKTPYCREYFDKSLIKACPEQKIINKMPVMCIQAPCGNVISEYYIYKGERKEVGEFDTTWVGQNCKVPESIVY
jgi:peptidoglycan hydrolase-like protein with peptidoglycan-binding domain